MTNDNDLSGAAFGDVDGSGYAGDFINYLDHATDHFRPIKRFAQSQFRLKPGDRVLDVGCGCGDDIREMARSIIPNGYAAGIDVSQSMIEEARRRSARFVAPVQFVVAAAEDLPWASAYFDACLADRVFQHLRNPARALNEMLRVTKPCGRVVVTDRDWGMVSIDAADAATSSVVLARACAGIRNGCMGRNLLALFDEAGVRDIQIHSKSINVHSFAVADLLLDLQVVVHQAVAEKRLNEEVASQWLDDLMERDATKMFFAKMTVFIACGMKM
jgi:SAM-dependent methyltransferase